MADTTHSRHTDPPSASVEAADHADVDLDGLLRGPRLFDTDTGFRGFLSDDADLAAVETRAEVRRVERPTPTDVFNFFVHLRG